jgi:hypothetical protein
VILGTARQLQRSMSTKATTDFAMRRHLYTLPLSDRNELWTIRKRSSNGRYFNELLSIQEEEPTLIVGASGIPRPSLP